MAGHSESISYRPFARGGDLWKAFSSVKSAKELLRFVNDHGPLTTRPSRCHRQIQKMFVLSRESLCAPGKCAKMFGDFLRIKGRGQYQEARIILRVKQARLIVR